MKSITASTDHRGVASTSCAGTSNRKLTTIFDTNWRKGGGATPLVIQDVFR